MTLKEFQSIDKSIKKALRMTEKTRKLFEEINHKILEKSLKDILSKTAPKINQNELKENIVNICAEFSQYTIKKLSNKQKEFQKEGFILLTENLTEEERLHHRKMRILPKSYILVKGLDGKIYCNGDIITQKEAAVLVLKYYMTNQEMTSQEIYHLLIDYTTFSRCTIKKNYYV